MRIDSEMMIGMFIFLAATFVIVGPAQASLNRLAYIMRVAAGLVAIALIYWLADSYYIEQSIWLGLAGGGSALFKGYGIDLFPLLDFLVCALLTRWLACRFINIGRSRWFALLGLVPIVNWVVLFAMMIPSGKPGPLDVKEVFD